MSQPRRHLMSETVVHPPNHGVKKMFFTKFPHLFCRTCWTATNHPPPPGVLCRNWAVALLMMLLFVACQRSGGNKNNAAAPPHGEGHKPETSIRGIVISPKCPLKTVRYFSKKRDVIPREETEKYYLITVEQGNPTNITIYLLDDAGVMDRVYRWLMQNCEELEDKGNVARIPQIFPWSNELQQFGRDGHSVSYVVSDAGRAEYERLVSLFQESGRLVETVPGRKPPKKYRDFEAIPIDWCPDSNGKDTRPPENSRKP
jgi:hypothetical protein